MNTQQAMTAILASRNERQDSTTRPPEQKCSHCGETAFDKGDKYNICLSCGRVNDKPNARPPEQAVPVDWQALAISRYERVQELLSERDRLRNDLNATIQRDNAEILMLTAQRDELLAAITNLTGRAVTGLNQSATHDGLVNCEAIKRARVAIAKCEANK